MFGANPVFKLLEAKSSWHRIKPNQLNSVFVYFNYFLIYA